MKTMLMLLAGAALLPGAALDSATDLNNAGTRLYAEARYSEAEALFRRAMAAWVQTGPEGQRGLARVLGNLGAALRATGRYSEAERLLLEAVGQMQAAMGPESADTGCALHNLAALYLTEGDLAKAEEGALRAGPLVDETERPANRQLLASIYIKQGRHDEAETILKPAAEGAEGKLLLTIELNRTVSAIARIHLADAAEYAQRAVDLARCSLPARHPAMGVALNNRAQVARFQGRYMEAERDYREAIQIWEDSLGPGHPDVAKGMMNLAAFYHERGRETGAEDLYERAALTLERIYGKGSAELLVARNELADVLRAERRYTESERMGRTTLKALEKTLDARDPRVVRAVANYERLLGETRKPKEAAASGKVQQGFR
jgi:tetratricopeptide (TPR) repeat protein